MEDLNWTYILYLIVGIPSSLTLCIIAKKDKSLSTLFFGLAIISFLVGLIIDFVIKDGVYLAREWGDLTGITFILSALFIKTRNSKPVFARFPLYLTLLPFIVLPFYPLVVNSGIVKDLLQSIYQGGAIIVGLLVISINHFLYKGRGLLIFSTLIFLLAFIIVSFLTNFFPQITVTLSNILFSIGIIVATIGFKKVSDNRNTQII
ncbi:MAG: hypothetical protein BalsKO_12210 [Balneolaceae bacterium]